MSKDELLFSIRYAARVLERNAKYWRKLDGTIRVAAILSGSAAFAALATGNQGLTMTLGIVFAICQALEFGIRPAEISAKSMAMRMVYARLFASARSMDEEALDAAYLGLVAEDDIVVSEWMRHIAYNDVVAEQDKDTGHAYQLNFWQRFAAFWL